MQRNYYDMRRKKEVVLHKKKKRTTTLYKVEALSKQRAHTIKGNAHTHTHTHSNTDTHMLSVFFFCSILNGDEDTGSLLQQAVFSQSPC